MSQEIYDTSKRPHPLVEEIQALTKYKEFVYQSIARSIKTRYKRSLLGVLWTILNPLLTMIVLTVVFSTIFRFSVDNYPVYILSGLVIWNYFASSTKGAMSEMLLSGDLLSRIYVPKSIFTLTSVGNGLFNLLLSLIPLYGIAIILGVPIKLSILITPISILIITIFALGVGLFLSTVSVFFADLLPIYDVLVTIWFYATPIIYPIEIVPAELAWIIKLNPLYYMIEIFRQPLLNGTIPEPSFWLISVAWALLAMIVGGYLFTSKSNEYAYRV